MLLQYRVCILNFAFHSRSPSFTDHRRSAIFLSALITRMHMFLSRSDQHRMISALKRLSLKLTALAPTTFVPSLPPVVQFLDVPRFASFRPLHRFAVLKRIMVASNADGKRSPPTLHVLKPVVASGDGTAAIVSADPFIYNPNDAKAKKGAAGARRKSKARHMVGHSDDDEEELAITAACTIVEGETARFLVVLDNPFLIDLEVENVSLIVSGMELQDAQIDKGMSERILLRARPKTVGDHGDQHHQSSKTEVCISGIPVKNGTLSIHGCLVQFGNGWVEEWLVGRTGRMLRRETTAAELTPFTSADQLTADNTHKMEVVVAPRQPLLKVKHTAKMHQLDMTLFEGEKRSLKLTVDNIGLDVARHVRVVCKERIER